MAWVDVKALFVFRDLASGQTWTEASGGELADVPAGAQLLILGYLEEVYNGSQAARNFLDLFAATATPIKIGTAANAIGEMGFASAGGGYIGIDLSKVSLTYYMNDHGMIVTERPALALLHELYHMFWGVGDPSGIPFAENTAGYDHNGQPVDFQNSVALEMGWNQNVQSSYASGMAGFELGGYTDFRPFILTTGHSYTNGEQVAITRFGDPIGQANRNDDLDQTAKGNSNDLLMGFGGKDTLNGGGGRDFLYGGSDNDILIGGGGNDELYGGMEDDAGRDDGTDTVKYTSDSAGITVNFGSNISVQDGDGGTDTLHSIERIEGSSYSDILTLNSLTTQLAAAFDWIDLSTGNDDSVDVSQLAGAVTVDLRHADDQSVTFGGAVLHIRNVEKVTTGGDDDTVTPSESVGSVFDTGGGNDTVLLAGGGHFASGGAGEDVLSIASGITGSRIFVGSHTATLSGGGTSTFSGFEKITGGDGNDLIFGDGSGMSLSGGGGVNYIEGSADDIMESGSGDTYFAASDGATVISGGGNDYIEVTGSASVTIKFGVGSGHDMLGSYFRAAALTHDPSARDEDWVMDRRNDLIILDGLSSNDIELIWNYTEEYYSYSSPSGSIEEFTRTGEAAIRIKSTGETLFLGTIKFIMQPVYFDEGEFYGMVLEDEIYTTNVDDYEQGIYCWDYLRSSPDRIHYGVDNDSDAYVDTFDLSIFSFNGVDRLNLLDLFDLRTISSTPLPAEVKAAQDVLDRLADAGSGSAGTTGSDMLTGSSGADDLFGSDGNDTLDGGDGDDVIRGGAGSDLIIGGAGNDSVDGGGGRNTLDYSASFAPVTVDLPQQLASGTDVGEDKFSNIEVFIGGDGDDTFWGDAAANEFHGSSGNDTLNGFAGDDVLEGGEGQDQLDGGGGDDIFLIGLGEGSDTIDGGDGWDMIAASADDVAITFASIANLEFISARDHANVRISGTSGSDLIDLGAVDTYGIQGIDGQEGDDSIVGSLSDDSIVGGLGDDFINGGEGIDTADYAASSGAVTVNLAAAGVNASGGAGNDTLFNIENIVGSSFADSLTGNAAANVLDGGAGDDLLEGGSDDDRLIGGQGSDTASYASAGSAVTVRLSSIFAQNTGGAGRDTLSAIENLVGSAFSDTLSGDAGANTIDGGDGNDVIQGGGGDDVLTGGTGIDTASYVGAASGVTVRLDLLSPQNTIGAGTDIFVSLENLTGSNFNDDLTGDAGANNINGGSGNDFIDGGSGNDVITGAAGVDIVSYASAGIGVTVSLAITSAQNTVGAGSDTLATVENLTGSAYNDALTGNTGNNVISGGSGNDAIDGGSGSDTLEGGDGNDTLTGNGGTDTVTYASAVVGVTVSLAITTAQNTIGAGTDTIGTTENLTGSGFADTLTGSSAANMITGAAGNDTINGGGGNDILFGGADGDFFVFSTALSGTANVDQISDFLSTADQIDLSQAIFAAAGPKGTLAASAFQAGTTANDAQDRIIYDQASGKIYYDADGSGASAQVLFAQVIAGQALTSSDFLVI